MHPTEKECAVGEESRQLSADLFDELWEASFRDVARDANDKNAYTARRFILESRLGEATRSMVTWTKWGVVLSLLTSAISIMIGVLRTLN